MTASNKTFHIDIEYEVHSLPVGSLVVSGGKGGDLLHESIPLKTSSAEVEHTSKGGLLKRFTAALIRPLRIAYNNGIICCVLAQLFYASVAVIIKMLLLNGIPILEILFIRSVFAALGCYIVIKVVGYPSVFGPRECWGLLAVRAIMSSTGMVLYFASVAFIPVGDAMALSKLTPLFTVLFSWILRWEDLNLLMAAGALVCSIGGLVISHPPLLFGNNEHVSEHRLVGNALAFGSSVFMAISFMAVGKMGTRVGEFSMALAGQLLCVIWMPLPLALSFPSQPVYNLTLEDCILFLVLIPLIILGNCMMTRGVQLCNGIQGSCFQTAGIIFSYTLGLFLLSENMTVFALVGTIVLGAGLLLVAKGKANALSTPACDEDEA